MVNVQEKINLIRFNLDEQSHVVIDKEKCLICKNRPCLHVCPAGMFTFLEGEIVYSYEGCLECGTCYIACEQKAITWSYPRGGYGVCFREA